MQWPRGPRLPDPCWIVVLLLLVLMPVRAIALAQDESAARAVALPDSVCRQLVEAFESLDQAALRAVLAPSEIEVAVMKGRRLPAADERRLSAEQAIVLLREAVSAPDRAVVTGLAPDAVLATRGTVGCRCPLIGSSGDDAFLVVHLGSAGRDGRMRRLYLDLRREGESWRIRAVREVL